MFSVRRAKKTDVDELVALRMELLREIGNISKDCKVNVLKKSIRQFFIQKLPKEEFIAWIAEVDEGIIGTSGLIFCEKPPLANNVSGFEGYIMNMYTVPEWRGKGVASTLLQKLMSYLKTRKIQVIRLHAEEAGKAIYKKAGFEPIFTEMLYQEDQT
ncbi:MAG: GNAT family N-acetyltransferase [Candidatus Hodarchaeota archaeon]